jgi:hypothetical protein
MIHELRTYTFHPGKLPGYLKIAEEIGRPIRGNDYGVNLGYWTNEFGTLNQIWHLWEYEDLNAREELRAKLSQNKDWASEYVAKIKPLIQRQDIRLMAPQKDFTPPSSDGNVYELRYYRTQMGRAGEWLGHFKDILPVREKYAPNVGLWHTQAPQPNEVVHLWAYDSLNDRADIRAQVGADKDWQGFLKKAGGILVEMNAIILNPSNYSPAK